MTNREGGFVLDKWRVSCYFCDKLIFQTEHLIPCCFRLTGVLVAALSHIASNPEQLNMPWQVREVSIGGYLLTTGPLECHEKGVDFK